MQVDEHGCGFPGKPTSALLLVGHGSSGTPETAATLRQAETIRQRRLFAEVHCAFWKQHPRLRDAAARIGPQEVYVVPHFISEGYFTREAIPHAMGLTGPTTHIRDKTWHYCDPVGVHPRLAEVLLHRARTIAPRADPARTSLVIVGHGTPRNARSRQAIRAQVDRLRAMNPPYAEILDAYLEEEPRIAEWDRWCTAPCVIVVPFFISDGLHTLQDIPRLLGLHPLAPDSEAFEESFVAEPVVVRGKSLHYSRALGSAPALAEIILDQVEAFDQRHGTGGRIA